MTTSIIRLKNGKTLKGHAIKVRLSQKENPFVTMFIFSEEDVVRFRLDDIKDLYTPAKNTRPGRDAYYFVKDGVLAY